MVEVGGLGFDYQCGIRPHRASVSSSSSALVARRMIGTSVVGRTLYRRRNGLLLVLPMYQARSIAAVSGET